MNTAPPAASQPTLRVQDLAVTLDLGKRQGTVVRDLTFEVRPGEIVGVVGESGSGKSMTALSIMRMLPKAATVTSGSVTYAGRNLLDLAEPEMRKLRGLELGMIFQDPLAFLNPLMTVGQQVREVLTLHGMHGKQADARVLELLELVGVRDPEQRIHDYPHEFSGGMRQRVIIAIAVANNPNLLICDEPTTALDVTVQAGILQLLRSLRDELGTAMVLITHDIGVVEEVCDTVMVMYAGRVVEKGSVSTVMADPRHPYTRELMRSTPRVNARRQRRLPTIPGQPPDAMSDAPGCPFLDRCAHAEDRCAGEMPPLDLRSHKSVDGTDSPARHLAACWVSRDALPAPVTHAGESVPPASTKAGDIVLDVTDLHVAYSGSRRGLRFWQRSQPRAVVQGVDLQVRAGEALGLVGESGCGKSTTARTIMGMLEPQSGRVQVAGRDWRELDARQRVHLRRTVQMIFQDTYLSLNPRQSLEDLLTEPLQVHRIVPRGGESARVRELLDMVSLPATLLDRYPYQLSGGQRQRVGLARALAMEPKLIVADEPVSALDVSVQAQIINLLADLREQLGLAYVVITHDLSVVRHLCERVAVMNHGRIVEHGSVSEIFENPQDQYTRTLLAAVPGVQPALPGALL